MNRTKENDELIRIINESTNNFKFASKSRQDKLVVGINTSILLDISRSLAVIADTLQSEKEADVE